MSVQPWREIAATLADHVAPITGVEEVTLRNASGRILAVDVRASTDIPSAPEAVMDGYALGSAPPGAFTLVPASKNLGAAQAVGVRAGDALPEAAVAVVLAHRATVDAKPGNGGAIFVPEAQPRDNIRRRGEEIRSGSIILSAGTVLDHRHLALARATGGPSVSVRRRPRVALVAVGRHGAALPQVDVLAGLLTSPKWTLDGAITTSEAQLPRTLTALGPRHDLIIVTAQSLDAEDSALVAALADASVLRAALKPAKPLIVGHCHGAMVIGLGGTAYAVAAAAHLFLRPVLRHLLGLPERQDAIPAISGFARARSAGRAEMLPVVLRSGEGAPVLHSAGRFGQLSALAALDGFALIEADAGDLVDGAPVGFIPYAAPLL